MSDLLRKGTFILSLDTELAWGSAHYGKVAQREKWFQLTRVCISRLLELLERFQISATWAVVGHLFLEKCQPVNGVKHPEIIRPTYSWLADDWLAVDPCSQLEDAPIWYGKDIIQQILSCKVSQEIGCHTFSHIQVGDPGCSRDCFASELRACRLAAEEFGVTLKSLVFPLQMVGHLDVLREHGFIAYRGNLPPRNSSRMPRIVRWLIYCLSAGPTILPEERMELWDLPMCLSYPPPHYWTYTPAVALQVWKAKRALRRAAQERRLFHLCFHPFHLAANPDRFFRGLEDIFAEFRLYRDAGLLDNLNMGQLAHALQLSKE